MASARQEKSINQMSLYELSQEFMDYDAAQEVLAAWEHPTTDSTDEEREQNAQAYLAMEEALHELEGRLVDHLETKVDSWVHFIRNLELSFNAAESERKRIADIASRRKKKLERVKTFLKKTLQQIGVKRLKTPKCEIAIFDTAGSARWDGRTWVNTTFSGKQEVNLGAVVSRIISDFNLPESVQDQAYYYVEQGMSMRDATERAVLEYITDEEVVQFTYSAAKVQQETKKNKALPAGFSIEPGTRLSLQ